MNRQEAIYAAGWLEGATLALWHFVGEDLSDESVALMETHAHKLADYIMKLKEPDTSEAEE